MQKINNKKNSIYCIFVYTWYLKLVGQVDILNILYNFLLIWTFIFNIQVAKVLRKKSVSHSYLSIVDILRKFDKHLLCIEVQTILLLTVAFVRVLQNIFLENKMLRSCFFLKIKIIFKFPI